MDSIILPRGVRNRWYYVIVMPLDEDGNGPASDQECHKITWEVWDQVCETYGSFDYLPDAIDHAEKLNEEHLEWERKDG